MFIKSMSNFKDYLQEEIKPWLKENVVSGQILTDSKTNVQYYYALNPNAKASITIVHGFCEFFSKYHEVFYRFYQAGYSVFFLELRGHGYSSRKVKEKDAVYIKNYEEYILDLHAFTKQIVLPNSKNLKHVLFAHSMGGCVSTLYLASHPEDYDYAILSSPMLKINYGGVKPWQIRALTHISNIFHLGKLLVPTATHFTGEDHFENSSALDRDRYLYQMSERKDNESYQTWSATYDWTIASKKATNIIPLCARIIQIPILLMQAEKDTMVDNEGQNLFKELSHSTTFVTIPNAKHELYNGTEEIRNLFYENIFSFLHKYDI